MGIVTYSLLNSLLNCAQVAKRHGVPIDEAALQTRVGLMVRHYRQQRGLTQEELAWRAALHRTYLADVERGGRNLTLRSIGNLAHALQIPVECLLQESLGGAKRGRGRAEPAAGGEILLVEDSAADVTLTLRVFQRAQVSNPIKAVRDGEEALAYLFRTGPYAKHKDEQLPQLILLDLKLPGMAGTEVLRRVKANEATANLPVVILSVTRYDRAIEECERLGAADYIVKPLRLESLSRVMPKLRFHWTLGRSEPTKSRRGE